MLGLVPGRGRRPPVQPRVPARPGPALPGDLPARRSLPGRRRPGDRRRAHLVPEAGPAADGRDARRPRRATGSPRTCSSSISTSRPDEPGRGLRPRPPARRTTGRPSTCPSSTGRGTLGPDRDPPDPPVRPRPDQARAQAPRGARADPGGRPVLHPGRSTPPGPTPRATRSGPTIRKTFRAGPADETQPDPKTWTIARPGRLDPRPPALTFPEPLDRAILDERPDAGRRPGRGRRRPGRGRGRETRWRFTPERPGPPGDYQLLVDDELEDLAGNSIGRPFEVDVSRADPAEPRSRLRSTIRPALVVDSPIRTHVGVRRDSSATDVSRASVAQPAVESRWA